MSATRGPRDLSIAPFFVAVALTALVASRFRPGTWYESLTRPAWTPPDWIFAPVWTLLYVGIAIAGWLAWRDSGRRFSAALGVWAAQLLINGLWSWIFFGLHRPGAALVDILALLALILGFIVLARPISPASSWLFLPYALWVAYASALNAAIWLANRPGA